MTTNHQTHWSIEVNEPWLLTVSYSREISRTENTNCILGTLLRERCDVVSSLSAYDATATIQ